MAPKRKARSGAGDVNDMMELAEHTYHPDKPTGLNNYDVLDTTPTATVYRDKNNGRIVMGFRGTNVTDPNDLLADLSIPAGKLRESKRYKTDEDFVNQMIQKYGRDATYELTGHSLGGALASEYRRKLASEGLKLGDVYGYNAAVQPQDIAESYLNPNAMQRVYHENDPLYKTMGRFTNGSQVVRGQPVSSGFAGLKDTLDAHKISSIRGKVHNVSLGRTQQARQRVANTVNKVSNVARNFAQATGLMPAVNSARAMARRFMGGSKPQQRKTKPRGARGY